MVDKKMGFLRSDGARAVCFWLCVLVVYFGAMFIRGGDMTNDETIHWASAVYVGSCQPSIIQIVDMPTSALGPVPYLIWGNVSRILGYHPMVSRMICTLVAVSFAFIYWLLIRKRVKESYIVMLLLLTQAYFFLPSHSILTDNFPLLFIAIFFGLTLNRQSVSLSKGVIGLICLCLALYSRVWYIIVPLAFILVAVSSYAFGQRPRFSKTVICLLGLISVLPLIVHWRGFVAPQLHEYHRMAITLWVPVLVISNVGVYLGPLVLLTRIKRGVWIATALLSPIFIALIVAGSTVQESIMGSLVTTPLFAIGKVLFGSQAAGWIFFPFWIVGLALLIHMLVLAYNEFRKVPVWSESRFVILAVVAVGYLASNMIKPMWGERYLTPFFICIFPFIPRLIERWKKAVWAWLCILFIVALSHMAVQKTSYKRSLTVEYKNVEQALQNIDFPEAKWALEALRKDQK